MHKPVNRKYEAEIQTTISTDSQEIQRLIFFSDSFGTSCAVMIYQKNVELNAKAFHWHLFRKEVASTVTFTPIGQTG